MTTLPQTTSIRMPRSPGGGALAIPGAAVPAPAPAVGMTAGDVWRVIRANTWLILGALILGLVSGFLVNMYLAKNYSRFTAIGWIEIQPRRQGGNVIDAVV